MTAVYVAAGLVASLVPDATAFCIHDRTAVLGGAWWRLLSAHLVHSSVLMALLDLGAVAVLGSWIERRSRSALIAVLGTSSLAVGLGVLLVRPDLARFHGASGVACALFAWVVVDVVRNGQSSIGRRLAFLALAVFVFKSAWETITGRAWMAGTDVVPSAHFIGALVGLAAGLLRPPAASQMPAPGP